MDEQLLHSFIFLPEKAERMGSSQARIHSQARHTAARLFGKVFRKKVFGNGHLWKCNLLPACLPARASKPTSEHVAFAFARSFAKLAPLGRGLPPCRVCVLWEAGTVQADCQSEEHAVLEHGVLCAKFLSPHQRPLTQRLRPDHWSHHSHWSQFTPLVTGKWQVATDQWQLTSKAVKVYCHLVGAA